MAVPLLPSSSSSFCSRLGFHSSIPCTYVFHSYVCALHCPCICTYLWPYVFGAWLSCMHVCMCLHCVRTYAFHSCICALHGPGIYIYTYPWPYVFGAWMYCMHVCICLYECVHTHLSGFWPCVSIGVPFYASDRASDRSNLQDTYSRRREMLACFVFCVQKEQRSLYRHTDLHLLFGIVREYPGKVFLASLAASYSQPTGQRRLLFCHLQLLSLAIRIRFYGDPSSRRQHRYVMRIVDSGAVDPGHTRNALEISNYIPKQSKLDHPSTTWLRASWASSCSEWKLISSTQNLMLDRIPFHTGNATLYPFFFIRHQAWLATSL
jgi:hypothetical protein